MKSLQQEKPMSCEGYHKSCAKQHERQSSLFSLHIEAARSVIRFYGSAVKRINPSA